MQVHLPNIQNKNIIIFDIEYDQGSLVQIAWVTLQRIENSNCLYQLAQSMNLYIQQPKFVSKFFKNYTNIDDKFLEENGISLQSVQEIIKSTVPPNTLIVSHGVKCDIEILKSNGIDWSNYDHYCTYENSKKILNKTTNLTLKDIAALDGYYLFDEHNAYADVWGTLHALCYLKSQESKNE